MFHIMEKNGPHYKENIMLIKITDREIIHDIKDLILLNCVEMCLKISVQRDIIDTTMIDDLFSRIPFHGSCQNYEILIVIY
jgi:hypothetical protein